MIRKLFVGVDTFRSQEDADSLSKAVIAACEEGVLQREADEFIMVMGARELSSEAYEVVRKSLEIIQSRHFKVVAMIPKGFFSVGVLCSLAGADTIVVEAGAKMALNIEHDHPCISDQKDFVKSLSSLGDRPFVRNADEIAEIVQKNLIGDGARAYSSASIDEEIMDRQIACEDYVIINPLTKEMIKDQGDLSCLDALMEEEELGRSVMPSLSMC